MNDSFLPDNVKVIGPEEIVIDGVHLVPRRVRDGLCYDPDSAPADHLRTQCALFEYDGSEVCHKICDLGAVDCIEQSLIWVKKGGE